MKKPIIGITGTVLKDPAFDGYRRSYVSEDYVNSIIANGGVPYILPVTTDKEVIERQVEMLDGLLLSGGHDVSPLLYGQEPKQKLGEVYPDRDAFEMYAIEKALERNIPILGICRGLQILNVYFGGTLYQDLSYEPKISLKHDQVKDPKALTHTVDILRGSYLQSILDKDRILTNSFHHQVIDELADEFDIGAVSKDGVIEAIESKYKTFLLAVQWHPEMLHEIDDNMNDIFIEFIRQAGDWHATFGN